MTPQTSNTASRCDCDSCMIQSLADRCSFDCDPTDEPCAGCKESHEYNREIEFAYQCARGAI